MNYEIDEITSARLDFIEATSDERIRSLELSIGEMNSALESLSNDVRATTASVTYNPDTLTLHIPSYDVGRWCVDKTPDEDWFTTSVTFAPNDNFNETFKSWLNDILQEAKRESGKELSEISLEDFDKILRGEYEAS